MPAQSRTADQHPKRTPSFVCEVPLRVRPHEERTLLARLEAHGRSTTPAWARHASGSASCGSPKPSNGRGRFPGTTPSARRSKERHERSTPSRTTRLEAYAQQFGHAWLGEHLDSHVLQKLATRAYGAANRLLVGRAKRVRFKGRHQLDSVEGKTNAAGMRWCVDHLEWSGLALPARLDPRDLVMVHGLSFPVKYVRLVRRKVGLRNRFSAQLVCEGRPYRKAQHPLTSGHRGTRASDRAPSRWWPNRRRCSSRSAPR